MKQLLRPAVALFSLVCAMTAHANYQAEASLRYGPMHTELGRMDIAAPSLEIRKSLDADGANAIGLNYTHYAWTGNTEYISGWGQVYYLLPILETRLHVKSQRNALMASYRHRWSPRPTLSLYGCFRIGANEGKNQLTLLPIDSIATTEGTNSNTPSLTTGPIQTIIWPAYQIPVSTRTSWSLCAETEWGISKAITETWTASMGIVASCLEARADAGSAQLQGIQAKAGIECRF